MNDQIFDPTDAAKAQERYCDEHKIPLFAPHNGWCFNCCRNIYEPYTYRREPIVTSGITVEEAGSRHITSCPHCNATFCG